jgi:hypothetical protein
MKDYKILEIGNIRISFAWYDIWIGVYVDKDRRRVYICPIPTILVRIEY